MHRRRGRCNLFALGSHWRIGILDRRGVVGGVLTSCWLETWLILIGVIWADGPYEGGINAGHPADEASL